ncbi:MAG: alkaline phosphatase D family protein [Verrucomicrobiales bacterium]
MARTAQTSSRGYGPAPDGVGSGSVFRGAARLLAFLAASGLATAEARDPSVSGAVERIALGSCANQNKNHVIWEAIVAQSPDLFLFLGDNVYADTEDMAEMRAAYDMLGAKPGYRKLLDVCPVLAVWDDHDYGVNDGGAEYPMRDEAEEAFHDFFGTPEDAPSRRRPGIYDVRWFGEEEDGKRLQILMLDTRYFRGELVELPERSIHGPYDRNRDRSATVLGEDQWRWLEEQLVEPADLRLIMTSIQFLPQDHHWELWENFPHERKRLLDLLGEADAAPVIFASGDRHMGELMKLKIDDPLSPGFPIYEMTTSGLTNAGGGRKGEPNRHRVSPTNFQSRNFGLMTIDWPNRSVLLELRDVEGTVVDSHAVDLDAER